MKWSTKGVQVLQSMGYQIVIPAPHDNEVTKLDRNTEYTVEIKPKGKRRSLNANAYAWLLMEKIAKEVSKDGGAILTKEDVYRQAIKAVGSFTYIPVRNDAVNRFIEIWQAKGLGWIAYEFGACRGIEGYTNIIAYNGSSTYLTDEMKRLLDYLVDECNQLGIAIEPTAYVKSLLEAWEHEQT